MSHHCNRLPFEGVLTLVDVPSDAAPSGARGHRVMLTRDGVEEALPELLGMGVNYKAGWDGHDQRQKVGVITWAELDAEKLRVKGYIYARDFPEIAACKEVLGMSFELDDAHVADMRQKVWTLSKMTFTGAAIMLRSRAAYKGTSFSVVPA